MFKFFQETLNLENHTLIVPAVAVGNVGQLTLDLLIHNLEGCQKIGRVFHDALESAVGNEILENGQASLMTSCESKCLSTYYPI